MVLTVFIVDDFFADQTRHRAFIHSSCIIGLENGNISPIATLQADEYNSTHEDANASSQNQYIGA